MSIGKRLVKGQLWPEVTHVTNLGSYEGFTQHVPSHIRPVLFEYHISSCYLFALEVVRGHDFWTHLEMCVIIFDLLPPIFENGTVSGEMSSSVALMTMVIKFGQTD